MFTLVNMFTEVQIHFSTRVRGLPFAYEFNIINCNVKKSEEKCCKLGPALIFSRKMLLTILYGLEA